LLTTCEPLKKMVVKLNKKCDAENSSIDFRKPSIDTSFVTVKRVSSSPLSPGGEG
jgi:hypothetical protein